VVIFRNAQLDALRMGCRNSLKNIAIGLRNYHDVHGTFPPPIIYSKDGIPMHSWRVLILPVTAGNTGTLLLEAYDFSEPWNSPKNRDLSRNDFTARVMRSAYQCPAMKKPEGYPHTSYFMLIDDRYKEQNTPPKQPGGDPQQFSAQQIIVVETIDTDVHWMEPRDVLLSELSFKINDPSKRSISSRHGGAFVLYADGNVQFLDDSTTVERIEALLTQGVPSK
jgi:hypothetical protein